MCPAGKSENYHGLCLPTCNNTIMYEDRSVCACAVGLTFNPMGICKLTAEFNKTYTLT